MKNEINDNHCLQQIESLYTQAKKEFPHVKDITAPELLTLLTNKEKTIILVDVRTPAEQTVSMLPGALTMNQFESNISKYTHAAVVVYCKTGYRSGHYAKRLMAQSFTNVRNLQGSILAWTHAGGPLQNASGPTKKVNVLAPQNDLTAQAYQGVW